MIPSCFTGVTMAAAGAAAAAEAGGGAGVWRGDLGPKRITDFFVPPGGRPPPQPFQQPLEACRSPVQPFSAPLIRLETYTTCTLSDAQLPGCTTAQAHRASTGAKDTPRQRSITALSSKVDQVVALPDICRVASRRRRGRGPPSTASCSETSSGPRPPPSRGCCRRRRRQTVQGRHHLVKMPQQLFAHAV
jgi:hypothetical protein